MAELLEPSVARQRQLLGFPLVDADIATGANINAAKIGTGVVSNTEFDRLNGITSALEEQANKGAVSGYAGLDASQELLLTNFPSGTGLQVLRRNSGNTALEFATLSSVTSLNDLSDVTITGPLADADFLIYDTVGSAFKDIAITGDVLFTKAGVTTIQANTVDNGKITAHTSTKITITAKGQLNSAIVYNDQANVFGDFIQTFKDNSITIESPDGLTPVTITNLQQTLARTLSIPILTANRTIVVTTEASQITIGTEVTGASTDLTDTADIAYLNTANTYTAGTRQDFLGLLAGTAGLNVGGIAGNPTSQVNGDLWYNSTSNTLFARINGANVDLAAAGAGDMVLADVQTVTGAKTFGTIGGAVGKLILAGSTSGSTILNAAAVAASTILTLPSATDTLMGKATADVMTNKSYDLGGTGNVLTGSVAEFNTALQSETFAYIGVANAWGTVNQNIAATGKWQEAGANISPIGTHTQWIPAGAWGTVTTNGAEFAELELATNDIMLQTFNFDQTTAEKIQFWWEPPAEWNGGVITFNVKWTAASGSGTVTWKLEGHSYSNDDAIDAAIGGTAASVTDTLITANDMHISPQSGNVTINGATKGEAILMQLSRDIADTLTADAKFMGVNITFTTDEATKD